MSLTLKNVSNEEKLKAAKDIVIAYINNSSERKGDDWSKPTLTPDKVCDLLKKIFQTMEEILPVSETKVGLH
jgi:hypothetical protein